MKRLEVSGAVWPLYKSLGVKRLIILISINFYYYVRVIVALVMRK